MKGGDKQNGIKMIGGWEGKRRLEERTLTRRIVVVAVTATASGARLKEAGNRTSGGSEQRERDMK
eukprot:2061065-Pleurochrysis_carterae.AAC.2